MKNNALLSPFCIPEGCSFVAGIVPYTKALATSHYAQRGYDIVRLRLGLEGGSVHRLQTIGDVYGLSRERVRQIEWRIYRKLKAAILDGKFPHGLPVQSAIKVEARTLQTAIMTQGAVVAEANAIELIGGQSGLADQAIDHGVARLIMHLFGYEALAGKIAGADVHACWIRAGQFDRKAAFQVIKHTMAILRDSPTMMPTRDIQAAVRQRTQEEISDNVFDMTIKMCRAIEKVGEDGYQFKFSELPSLADKAYRVLLERGEGLYLQEIVQAINDLLALADSPPDAMPRSLASQLVHDDRFVPIGRSGKWVLAEWDHIYHGTIVELMCEFFQLSGKSATLKEVFEYVSANRPDASIHSVDLYLTSRKEFIRTDKGVFELAQWGKSPCSTARRPRTQTKLTLRSRIQAAITEHLSQQPQQTQLVSKLGEYVMTTLGCPRPTFYAYLATHPLVKKKETGQGLACYLTSEVPKCAAADTVALAQAQPIQRVDA